LLSSLLSVDDNGQCNTVHYSTDSHDSTRLQKSRVRPVLFLLCVNYSTVATYCCTVQYYSSSNAGVSKTAPRHFCSVSFMNIYIYIYIYYLKKRSQTHINNACSTAAETTCNKDKTTTNTTTTKNTSYYRYSIVCTSFTNIYSKSNKNKNKQTNNKYLIN
jgi:hypothetical protein